MRHKDIESIKLIDDGKYRSVECKMANGDPGVSVFWCAFVSNTKISIFVVTI